MKNEIVQRFHHEMVELIKRYQFRDRNEATCCGVSVSQCYLVEALHRFGPMTMKDLAEKLYLSISTVTRLVDPLTEKGYVRREEDARDRRFKRIHLTADGETLYQNNWKHVFESEKIILEHFPEEHREMLIQLLKKLNAAVDGWRKCCSG